jgi:hypothetical protein
MAITGRKPVPQVVRLATGNRGRRPLPLKDEPAAVGTPIKPPKLRGRALELWDEACKGAPWLAAADSYKLFAWCCLQAELERAPNKMVAARIGQLRALGSELGLDPSSRTRLATGPELDLDDPAAKYLGPKIG